VKLALAATVYEVSLMAEVYHQSVTFTVTRQSFNPTLEVPGRVLEVLASCAPIGTLIEAVNRDLSEAVQCSPGSVPRALRYLEQKGWIERVTSPRGSLIMVTERSGMADRSPRASQRDQYMADRSIEVGSAEVTETPDRSTERSAERSAMADPPTPPIRYQHDQHEQQLLHGRDLRLLMGEQATDRDRPERVFPEQWRQIQAANPGYTAHDFMRELAIASGRPDVADPVALVVGVRKRGQAIYAPKEAPNARPRRPHAPDRRGRSAGRSVPQPEQPALTREYLQSRPRRGDRLREVPGGGPAAGG
jgi:DNA-binding MarR family transcriptional regulator